MPELALYLKWRPQRFEEVIGQEPVTETLRNSLNAGRLRHAYLFSGQRGTGKTTVARLLAKAINCNGKNRPCGECEACLAIQEGRYLDLIELDAATHTGVDDVRNLREKAVFAPSEGPYKVYIIDEVHRFSGGAFDALLKTLEEPPAHAVFVLATTEIQKVPQTIQSRCLHFAFRRVPLHEIAEKLEKIVQAEGFSCESGALKLIAREGNGSVRDSISLLDQMLTDPEETLNLEKVQNVLGTGNQDIVWKILDSLRSNEEVVGLSALQEAIDGGFEPRRLAQQLASQLRVWHLWQMGVRDEDLVIEFQSALEKLKRWPRGRILNALKVFAGVANQLQRSWQPQLDLELAFLQCLEEPTIETRNMERAAQSTQPIVKARADTSPAQPLSAKHDDLSDANLGRPTAESGAQLSLRAIQSRWPELVEQVGRRHNAVPALLRQVEAMEFSDETLQLYTKALFLEKWEDQEKQSALLSSLRELFGEKLNVSFVDSSASKQTVAMNGGKTNPLEALLPIAREMGAEVSALTDED